MQGVEPSATAYTIMLVYFVQGVLGLASLARTFYFKDELGLPPAEQAALMGITTLPWLMKPLYGFMSDGLPLLGYRRKSYLALAGSLGSLSWLSLATVVHTVPQAIFASTAASLGVAVSDVVVDSLVVERARDDKSSGSGALQALSWSCQSAGALASAYFSGSLLETLVPQQVFALTACFPLLVVGTSFGLPEQRVAPSSSSDFGALVRDQTSLLWSAVQQKRVWLPALFLVAWQATPACDTAYFYFLSNELGIGPEFLGRVRIATSLASLLGIAAYRRYLVDVPIKSVLFWASLASAPLGLTQLLLVYGVNRQLGIPDGLFTLGDSLVLTVLGQLAFMPLLVLAASICPPGVEGTLFATLMSLFNGAGVLGSELGAGLTSALGVTESNFDNLGPLVAICNLSSLLPLLAINWLDAAVEEREVDEGPAMDKADDGISRPESGDEPHESEELRGAAPPGDAPPDGSRARVRVGDSR